jgi:hypothetical protein
VDDHGIYVSDLCSVYSHPSDHVCRTPLGDVRRTSSSALVWLRHWRKLDLDLVCPAEERGMGPLYTVTSM